MYICIFTYTCVHSSIDYPSIDIYIYMYIYIHTCILAYLYTCIFVCYIYIYVYNAPINGPPLNCCVCVCVRMCVCVCVHTFASVNALDHVAFFEAARRVGNSDYRHLLVAGVSPQLHTRRHDARGSLVGFRPRYARHVCMRIIVMAWMLVWMLVLTITSTLHAVSVFNVVVAAMLLLLLLPLLLLLLLLLWVVVKGSG